jgi:hypothetical protein
MDGTKTVLKLKTSTGTPVVYTAVAELISVGGPNTEVASIAQPKLGGTNKTFRPSCKPDSGTVEVSAYYTSDLATIRTLATVTPAIKDWKIEYDGGGSDSFSGFVTSFGLSGSEEDQDVVANFSIKITGSIVSA